MRSYFNQQQYTKIIIAIKYYFYSKDYITININFTVKIGITMNF